MPRIRTSNANAELAVDLFDRLLSTQQWGVDKAWLAIAKLLVTCNVWEGKRFGWQPLHGLPVVMERNNYRPMNDGRPNVYMREASQIGSTLAAELGIAVEDLCDEIGLYFNQSQVADLQPNNIRGHAFRSLVAETLSRFGDQSLSIAEEVSPYDLFPGFRFQTRSKDPKIDVVAMRGPVAVALISVRWTYRHDRVDLLDEALSYGPASRRNNPSCRYFGVVAEFGEARLKKVTSQAEPIDHRGPLKALVHLNVDLATTTIGHNSELTTMWNLKDLVADSFSW